MSPWANNLWRLRPPPVADEGSRLAAAVLQKIKRATRTRRFFGKAQRGVYQCFEKVEAGKVTRVIRACFKKADSCSPCVKILANTPVLAAFYALAEQKSALFKISDRKGNRF